jgi:transcriptional regulator with XRE-family HTH domain
VAKFKTLKQFVAAREKKGRRRYQVADELQISPSMLTEYLSRVRTPSRTTAKRIADLTGIPVTNLLYPSGDAA